jgi:beta-glucosidase
MRGLPVTAMDWEVQPEGLTRLLRRVKDEYTGMAIKLYVTENGAAYNDVVESDGSINDVDRAEFLRLHLDAILDAIDDGVEVSGYFYWSRRGDTTSDSASFGLTMTRSCALRS